jgi:hypothetical protein
MKKVVKLTNEHLRKLIAEEAAKAKFDHETPEDQADAVKEVDADELADTLAKKVDMLKALKIEESRLQLRLKRIAEQKQRLAKKLR